MGHPSVQVPTHVTSPSCKSRMVVADFGDGPVECVIDSGAEISVLKPSMLACKIMKEAGSVEILLQRAFGDNTPPKW